MFAVRSALPAQRRSCMSGNWRKNALLQASTLDGMLIFSGRPWALGRDSPLRHLGLGSRPKEVSICFDHEREARAQASFPEHVEAKQQRRTERCNNSALPSTRALQCVWLSVHREREQAPESTWLLCRPCDLDRSLVLRSASCKIWRSSFAASAESEELKVGETSRDEPLPLTTRTIFFVGSP